MLRLPALGLAYLAMSADASNSQYSRTLRFSKDGEFKIVTLSDLYFNDSAEDYLQTQGLIEKVFNE